MTIKRYWLSGDIYYGVEAEEEPDGEWVKYEDHRAAVERLYGLLKQVIDTNDVDMQCSCGLRSCMVCMINSELAELTNAKV